jgi:TetR/AcrR family transcriptional regulator, regulator of cefoperazone and chloramphenicol sensitivity
MITRQLKPLPEESSDTEKRLLDAAGEVFAEFGFRTATVRQICKKAGANVAAVNYYFRDKEGLYLAVLRSVPDAHAEKYPSQVGLTSDATPEQQLRVYVQSLMHRVFDAGRPGWHSKIIAREMVEPTRALDTLLEDVARPLHRELASIVRRLLGSAATDENVRLGALSVMGQCVYYHHSRTVLKRLYPEQMYGAEDIARMVDHITEFSLAGLQEFAHGRQANSHVHSKN